MVKEYRTTCPFCSLHCTDMCLTLEDHQVIGFTPACSMGQAGFTEGLKSLAACVSSGMDQKLKAEITRRMQPGCKKLILLAGNLHQEAVLAAVDLARQTNSTLVCDEDTSGSLLSMAMIHAGCLTATLGEWARSIDHVVYAGVSPDSIPPRIEECLARGNFKHAIHFSHADPVVHIQRMRLALCGQMPYSDHDWEIINQATCGLVLFDRTWLAHGLFTAIELLQWLDEMNTRRRWYAVYLPPAPNSLGVVETLLTQTGYPGNIFYSDKKAYFDPRTVSAQKYLSRRTEETILVLGDLSNLPEPAQAALSRQNTIQLSAQPAAWQPELWLPVAQAGLDASGGMARLDGVHMEVPAIFMSHRPKIENVLSQLTKELRGC